MGQATNSHAVEDCSQDVEEPMQVLPWTKDNDKPKAISNAVCKHAASFSQMFQLRAAPSLMIPQS